MGTDVQHEPNVAIDNIEVHRVLILPAPASTQDEIAVTIRLGLRAWMDDSRGVEFRNHCRPRHPIPPAQHPGIDRQKR